MNAFFALVLVIQNHAAVISRHGPFTLEACQSEVIAQRERGVISGCVAATDLEAATQRMFGKSAADIWR